MDAAPAPFRRRTRRGHPRDLWAERFVPWIAPVISADGTSPPPLDILLEDGPLLAVNKPANLLTEAPAGIDSVVARVKAFLKARDGKAGNIYLGVPHRLDKPVTGVIVFAKNSKAAARLAAQFRDRQVKKSYRCIVRGVPDPPQGTLIDWLAKASRMLNGWFS